MRREGDRPRRPERHEERHRDLGLANREAPEDRHRQHPEQQPTPEAGPQTDEQEDQRDDDDRLPDQCCGLEREQGERPEGDGEQRRIAIELRVVRRGRLVVQRRARVEARPGVVVGVDVGERVVAEMEQECVDPDQDAEDGCGEQDREKSALAALASICG